MSPLSMTRRIRPFVTHMTYLRLFETVKTMNNGRAESKMTYIVNYATDSMVPGLRFLPLRGV